MCPLIEIQTIEGGQKDVLFRRTNIKKKEKKNFFDLNNGWFNQSMVAQMETTYVMVQFSLPTFETRAVCVQG